MAQKIRILICDNTQFWEDTWNCWVDPDRFEVQEVQPDAFTIFDYICNYHPHIIVLLADMKHISGFGMIKAVSAIPNYFPQFIITDPDPTTEKKNFAQKAGAAFYLSRPYANTTIGEICSSIIQSPDYFLHCPVYSPEQLVSTTLHSLSIPANLKGYRYLRHAILLALRGSRELESITKGLYPAIAKEFNTTPVSVERAIRHAIVTSWDHCNPKELQNYFSDLSRKPSNSQIILTIAEKLQLDAEL